MSVGPVVSHGAAVEVLGEAELLKLFEQLNRSMQKRILVTTARESTNVIAERARELAPEGAQKRLTREGGIIVIVTKQSRYYGEAAITYGEGAWHGILQEVGVRPHRLRGGGQHPGHKAQPHIRPAYDQRRDLAREMAVQTLRHELVSRARRLGLTVR